MKELTLEFTSQLKDQLVNNSIKGCLPILENLEVRAKGYYNFFGESAVPFGTDDYFSDFMLGRFNDVPFFTIKHSLFSRFDKHNLKNPLEDLLSSSDYRLLKKQNTEIKDYGWCGGLTYLPIENIEKEKCSKFALELMTFFLCHSFLTSSPSGLVVTANLKAKIDHYLIKCGFEAASSPHVIHKELSNNPAQIMILRRPTAYMTNIYEKYSSYNTNIQTYKKAA